MAQARLADVDCCNPGIRFQKCILGRLRRPAARNQDLPACSRPLGWPDQMEQGSTTVRIAVQVAVLIQAGQRCWIRHPFIEVVDLLRANGPRLRALRLRVHFDFKITIVLRKTSSRARG